MVRPTSTKSGFPAGNPVANLLVIIAGALVIGASIVLGFFAFLAVSAIVLVTAAVIGLRVWWFSRKLEKKGEGVDVRARQSKSQRVIEGEYKVVVKDRDQT